jgi:DivIVA domain-containing protein
MDWTHFEQLRVEGFTMVRRGYDKREVDRFLSSLAEWLETDAAAELGDDAVQRKLELVGKSTAHILLTTEKESQEMRRTAERECADLRESAAAAAKDVRAKADEYSSGLRDRTQEETRRQKEASTEQARKTVEEGDRRRAAAEAVVSDLETQRDAAVAELEAMRGELLATISKHTTRATTNGDASRRKRANINKSDTEKVEAPTG